MGLFKGAIDVPPLFIDQLAHVILRNILDGCDDPLELRAAELFFREQKATLQDGHVLLADLETVEMHASGNALRQPRPADRRGAGRRSARSNLDVLDRANAALYWERESRHDTVISLNYGRAALDALCRVIEAWVLHFLGVEVTVTPLRKIEEARWAWHIGLDAESTAILNDAVGGRGGGAGPHAQHPRAVRHGVRRAGGDAPRHRRAPGVPRAARERRAGGAHEAAEPAHQPAAA